MAVVKVYDQNRQESGEVTLAPEVFEVAVRPEILHFVVRAQRAAKRAGTHATLTRSKMEGGGAKPWRQKGTGRARSGSNISPVWRGGAVTFGPQPRDYSFKVNKKVKALALRMALSSRLQNETLLVVKGIELPEAKTRHFAAVVRALGLRKALIITPGDDQALARSARNLPGITLMTPETLNVYSILLHPQLVLFEGAVESVAARLM
jgi:large subunit ribosomal protein L4